MSARDPALQSQHFSPTEDSLPLPLLFVNDPRSSSTPPVPAAAVDSFPPLAFALALPFSFALALPTSLSIRAEGSKMVTGAARAFFVFLSSFPSDAAAFVEAEPIDGATSAALESSAGAATFLLRLPLLELTEGSLTEEAEAEAAELFLLGLAFEGPARLEELARPPPPKMASISEMPMVEAQGI